MEIKVEDGKVVESNNNYVAVKVLQNVNPLVRTSDGTEYLFRTAHQVCLCWVSPTHLDEMINMKKSACCGASPRKYIFLANEQDAAMWLWGRREI